LRILVTPTQSLGDLVDYLMRCGCSAKIVGSNVVEASPSPRAPVNTAYLRMELDAYLRVWRAMHPGAGADVLGQSASERVAATQMSGTAAEGTR
jgi:hypothetical protein